MANDAPNAVPAPTVLRPRRQVPRRKSSSSRACSAGSASCCSCAGRHRGAGHHRPRRQLPQLLQPGRQAAGEIPFARAATPPRRSPSSTSSGAILEGEDGFVKKQIDRVQEDRGRGRRRAADQFARRHRHRQRLSSTTISASWPRSASCRWWSAWAASAPAAATTSRWPSATSRTRSSPSRPPGPARSA